MKKLLSQLESETPKTAYQTYTLHHGIERIAVAVPLAKAPLFEEKMKTAGGSSKKALLEILAGVGGKVRG